MFILLILLIRFSLVYSSTTCSIFPSLNCSCFQSNIDLNVTLTTKIYSHLYCQGNSLNKTTFQYPFGSDFKHQSRFRTISIEIFNKNHVEIHSHQFDSLAMLFSQTNPDIQVNISLRFDGFSQITFHEYSLTSAMFQQKHQNKNLRIDFIPSTYNLTQMETNEENITNIEEQFHFSSNCFSGLIVSQLTLYIHTKEDHFSSLSSFEQIFNNTNIGELHLHGTIIPPSLSSLNRTFKGHIRSLILHRHVDIIDSTSFPFYSHVYSYTIHSIEAHSMNLSSFVPSYINLRRLEIMKPSFEVSINYLIPSLDFLTLDIEHLTDKTLLAARHIRHLKLGSRLRTINSDVLNLLSNRLYYFDLSDIDLSQMTLDSHCLLLKYFSNNSQQQQLNIIYPRIENLNECNCDRLFLNSIQINSKSYSNNNYSTCSKLCMFSDCQIISEYFKEKYSLNKDDLIYIVNETINDKNNSNEHFSSIDLYSDPIDVDMMSFLINQTDEQERNETQRRLTTTTTTTTISIIIDMANISVIENIEEYDDKIYSYSTPKFIEPSIDEMNEPQDPYRILSFSWLSFFIGVSVVFLLIIILSFIIFLIVQYRKNHNFKPVPVYV
ncbi:unnamed protein product [Adineta steineri]|uniref:Uncharacterized protein n=1 Tax=Adineta steineri TaxID=433720 RepID=A0A819DED9_9BILA|nr:unnamed protein product [Adineta steineri]CAF3826847.1 unnamed protein product [Adineta steineri]